MPNQSTQDFKPTVEGLLDFYQGILVSLGLTVSEEGLISMVMDEGTFPSVVKDKRLALPTPMVLREANWEQIVAFHPLSENVYRGESAVIKKLKGLINYRLTAVINCLITELTELAIDPASAEKLSPQQKEIFSLLPKGNAKTIERFVKVLDATTVGGVNSLINLYIKRGGKWKKEDYSQVAVVSFPVREHFNNEDNSIFGVKLANKKDLVGFKALFEYLLPNSDDIDHYSYGSRSLVAPRFDALMHAYLKVAKQLNGVTYLFRKHLDNYQRLMINHEWEGQLKNLAALRDLIPTLEENVGEVAVDEKVNQQLAEAPPNPYSVFQTPGMVAPQPFVAAQNTQPAPVGVFNRPPEQTEPEPTSGEGGLSWRELMEKKQKAAYGNQVQAQPNWPTPPPPSIPPPGFGGAPYAAGQEYQYAQYLQQQQMGYTPPGGYAQHPRNQPQQPMGYGPPMGYQQPVYPQQPMGYGPPMGYQQPQYQQPQQLPPQQPGYLTQAGYVQTGYIPPSMIPQGGVYTGL
jgi:hypothetical protein